MIVKRLRMCKGKVSFTNKGAAVKAAEKHGQRVYECPVCFCFHCTKAEDWREEFVPVEKYQNVLKVNEHLQARQKKLNVLRQLVHDLRTENARLRKEHRKVVHDLRVENIKLRKAKP